MVYGLEKQYNAIDLNNLDTTIHLFILVLGGGGTYDTTLPQTDRLSPSSLARLVEGIRIHNAFSNSTLIFSGYSSKNLVTQAELTEKAATALGVEKEKIVLLEKPTTTEEEVAEYLNFKDDKEGNLIIVTSDIHMPRAMFLFHKSNIFPIAAPSDHILRKICDNEKSFIKDKSKCDFWWVSNKSNFEKFSAAMHEYFGLIWAKI